MWGKQKGFTIVELLIVIVVIGILAAITIVAYNGIQTKARNQQMVAAASQAYKAISAYVVDNGSYPSSTSVSCVGSGYPIDTTGLCWSGQSGLSTNLLLAPYINQIPTPPMDKIGDPALSWARGMLLNAGSAVLEYTIVGATVCPSIGAPQGTTQILSDGNLWCRAILPSLQ